MPNPSRAFLGNRSISRRQRQGGIRFSLWMDKLSACVSSVKLRTSTAGTGGGYGAPSSGVCRATMHRRYRSPAIARRPENQPPWEMCHVLPGLHASVRGWRMHDACYHGARCDGPHLGPRDDVLSEKAETGGRECQQCSIVQTHPHESVLCWHVLGIWRG